MRTVKLDLAVRDIYRLHQALREAQPPYAVLGVGIDNRFTYINLEDSEQRDPTDLVMKLFPPLGLRLGSRSRQGADSVPEALADGRERIEIDVYKTDPETGFISSSSERIKISASGGVNLSQDTVEVVNGVGFVTLGPIDREIECEVTAEDASGGHASMRVRFVRPEKNDTPVDVGSWLKILS